MASPTVARSLRLIYVFQLLRSLQLFGAVVVPFYLEWAGLDYTRMFVLEASYSFFMFVLEVPTGTIADRFGRRASLVAGALVGGASFVLFGLTRSYPVYFVANFLCAVGAACMSGADQALLYDTLLADKSGPGDAPSEGDPARGSRSTAGAGNPAQVSSRAALARYGAIGSAGVLIGFPIGSFVAGGGLVPRPASLALVFVLAGVVLALAAVPLLFVPEPPRTRPAQHPLREGLDGVRQLLAPGPLRGLAMNAATISAATFFMFWFYQSLAREAGVPLRWYGGLGAGLNGLGMILLWKAGWLEARVGLGRLLFLTALLPALLYLALAGARPPAFALPAAFLIVGLKLLRQPLLADLINQRVESHNRATMLSGVSMLERAVVFVLYPLVGWAADRSLSVAFAGLGLVTLVLAVSLRWTPRPSSPA